MVGGTLLYQDDLCRMYVATDGNNVFEGSYPLGRTQRRKGKTVELRRKVQWFFQEPENLILIGYRRFCQEARLAGSSQVQTLKELVSILVAADRETIGVAQHMKDELRRVVVGSMKEQA